MESSRATLLIMAVFFLQPLTFGGWLALIPTIQQNLGLSKGELAFALFGMPVALIPSLQIAARIVARWGPRRMLMIGCPVLGLVMMLPLVAVDMVTLFLALAVAGIAVSVPELAMNVYAGRLETRAGLTIMNRCHAFWAVGLMAGSAVVSILLSGALWGLILLSLVFIPTAALVSWTLPRIADNSGDVGVPTRRLTEVPRALWFVGGMMLLVTLTEGAMADWSAVYMAERIGGDAARAGIAVTVFSAFMAAGRFAGDALKQRFGAVAVARGTIAVALAGVILLVLPLPNWALFPGFALVGFGVSVGYPLGVSAVASMDDRFESSNIALLAMFALTGFLLGPPLMGGLSQVLSLRVGIAALIPALILAFVLARWLAPSKRGA